MNWLKKATAGMLVAATLVTMVACSGGETTTVPTSTQKPTVSTNVEAENGDGIVYDNTSSKFRLNYPKTWLAVDNSNVTQIQVAEQLNAILKDAQKTTELNKQLEKNETILLKQDQPTTRIDITVVDTVSSTKEELSSPAFQNQYESQVKNAQPQQILVDKVKGAQVGDNYFVTMAFEQDNNKIAHRMTVQNGSMYVFTFTAQKEDYDAGMTIFEEILSSLSLTK